MTNDRYIDLEDEEDRIIDVRTMSDEDAEWIFGDEELEAIETTSILGKHNGIMDDDLLDDLLKDEALERARQRIALRKEKKQ